MIQVYNRQTNKYDTEDVAGEKYIKWAYESPIGKSFVELFIKRKLFSKLYGNYCDSKFSTKKLIHLLKTLILILIYLLMILLILKVLMIFLLENLLQKLDLLIKIKIY